MLKTLNHFFAAKYQSFLFLFHTHTSGITLLTTKYSGSATNLVLVAKLPKPLRVTLFCYVQSCPNIPKGALIQTASSLFVRKTNKFVSGKFPLDPSECLLTQTGKYKIIKFFPYNNIGNTPCFFQCSFKIFL